MSMRFNKQALQREIKAAGNDLKKLRPPLRKLSILSTAGRRSRCNDAADDP